MKGNQTVTINGRAYDAITGMPIMKQAAVSSPSAAKKPSLVPDKKSVQVQPAAKTTKIFSDFGPVRKAAPHHAHPHAKSVSAIHKPLQKSETLNRQAIKRPAVAQKPAITHFAPHPKPLQSHDPRPLLNHGKPAGIKQAARVQPQPAVKAVEKPAKPEAVQTRTVPVAPAPVTPQKPDSKAIKEALIKEGIARAESAKAARKKQNGLKKLLRRRPKIATIATATLALLLLGGYMTYLNLPNLSMRVAASRAGINATLPAYQPDGYSLNGSLKYAPGEVDVAYKSNSGGQSYSIIQKSTTWDSQAVLDKYVSQQTTAYLTFQDKGLTVYTYGNKAAWSNGGIFYSLTGNAPLSSDQILKIATSM